MTSSRRSDARHPATGIPAESTSPVVELELDLGDVDQGSEPDIEFELDEVAMEHAFPDGRGGQAVAIEPELEVEVVYPEGGPPAPRGSSPPPDPSPAPGVVAEAREVPSASDTLARASTVAVKGVGAAGRGLSRFFTSERRRSLALLGCLGLQLGVAAVLVVQFLFPSLLPTLTDTWIVRASRGAPFGALPPTSYLLAAAPWFLYGLMHLASVAFLRRLGGRGLTIRPLAAFADATLPLLNIAGSYSLFSQMAVALERASGRKGEAVTIRWVTALAILATIVEFAARLGRLRVAEFAGAETVVFLVAFIALALQVGALLLLNRAFRRLAVPVGDALDDDSHTCPSCRADLAVVPNSPVGESVCPSCAFSLVPPLALGRVFQAAGGDLADFARQAANAPLGGPCPLCQDETRYLELHEVSFNHCTACKVLWLGPGDLRRLTRGRFGSSPPATTGTAAFWRRLGPVARIAAATGVALLVALLVHRALDLCPSGAGMSIQKSEEELSFICTDPEGVRHGRALFLDPRGGRRAESHHRAGRQEGPHRAWFPNGAVKEEGQFRNDSRQGEWRYFDESGRLLRQVSYQSGRLHGPSLVFTDQGREEIAYHSGKRHGLTRKSDASGKLLVWEIWNNDRREAHGDATTKIPDSPDDIPPDKPKVVKLPTEMLFGGFSVDWWRIRLATLGARKDEKGRRFHELTLKRLEANGLRVLERPGGLQIVPSDELLQRFAERSAK